MKRKVIAWKDITPEREWEPTLECGHDYPIYEIGDGFTDERKAASNDIVECRECTELEAEEKRLKERLSEIRRAK